MDTNSFDFNERIPLWQFPIGNVYAYWLSEAIFESLSKEKLEGDLGSVPAELMGSFNIIFYNSAEDAEFKALGGD